MFERFFAARRKNERSEHVLYLTRRIAVLYTTLPCGPEVHADGPCSGTIKRSHLEVLSSSDNSFLSFDGKEEQEIKVEVLARGDENWIGFSVNGKRVRFFQKEEDLEVYYEEKGSRGWKRVLKSSIDWGSLYGAIDFVEKEFLSTD